MLIYSKKNLLRCLIYQCSNISCSSFFIVSVTYLYIIEKTYFKYIDTYIGIDINIHIYINICNLHNLQKVKLAKTQYLLTCFTDKLFQGKIIYKFISICELYLQLENLRFFEVLKQLYCGCGYIFTANDKGMYTKL